MRIGQRVDDFLGSTNGWLCQIPFAVHLVYVGQRQQRRTHQYSQQGRVGLNPSPALLWNGSCFWCFRTGCPTCRRKPPGTYSRLLWRLQEEGATAAGAPNETAMELQPRQKKICHPNGNGSDVSQLTGPQQRLHVEISQDIRLFFVCSARLFYSLFLLVQPPYFDVTGF